MICVSFQANDLKQSRTLLQKVSFAELRLDHSRLTPVQIRELMSLGKKTIVTCRPGSKSEQERKNLLISALQAGADYLDIEIDAPEDYREELVGAARAHCCNIIISYHNDQHTPVKTELEKIVRRGFDFRADVVKLACRVNQQRDNARLLALYDFASSFDGWLLALGMGVLGRITRIAAPLLGAPFTFASLRDEPGTAPGQLRAEEMRTIYKILDKEPDGSGGERI